MLRIALFLIVLLGLVFFLVSLPPIQSLAVHQSQDWFEKQTGADVEIKKIQMSLPAEAVFEDFQVLDDEGNLFASIKELRINMFDLDLFSWLFGETSGSKVTVKHIRLIEPVVHLFRREVDGSLNSRFLNQLLASQDTAKSNPSAFQLLLTDVEVRNGRFLWADSTSSQVYQRIPGRLNYRNLAFEQINGAFYLNFNSLDSLHIRVEDLNLIESNSGFDLNQFRVDLNAKELSNKGQKQIAIKNLFLGTKESQLWADGDIFTNSYVDLFDNQWKEKLDVSIHESSVGSELAGFFSPIPLPVSGIIYMDGDLLLENDHLLASNMQLEYGDSTRMLADIDLSKIFAGKDLEMEIDFANTRVSGLELNQLLHQTELPGFIQNLTRVELEGKFKGKYYDFVIDANGTSELGFLDTDLHVTLPPEVPEITYAGTIKTRDFDLNQWDWGNFAPSKKLNLDLVVNGRGQNSATMELSCKANFGPSDILNYSVDSAALDLVLKNQVVETNLWLLDDGGQVSLNGSLSATQSPFEYGLSGNLQDFHISPYLNLSKSIRITSDMETSIQGDSLDNTNGNIALKQVQLKGEGKQLDIPYFNLELESEQVPNKSVKFSSSLFQGEVEGAYTFGNLAKSANDFARELEIYFINDDSIIGDYYAQKAIDSTSIQLNAQVDIWDSTNALFSFFELPVAISSQSNFVANVELGEFQQIGVELDAGDLYVQNFHLEAGKGHLNVFKKGDGNEMLVAGDFYVDTIDISEGAKLKSIQVGINGDGRNLDFNIIGSQHATNNKFQFIIAALFHSTGRIEAHMDPYSWAIIGGDKWSFSEKNAVDVVRGELDFANFSIQHNDRRLNLEGKLSSSMDDLATLSLENLSIKQIASFFNAPYNFTGQLNSDIEIRQAFKQALISIKGAIRKFSLDDYAYGDLFLDGNYGGKQNQLDMVAKVFDASLTDTTLVARGSYNPKADRPIRLLIDTDSPFPFSYIEPFVKGQLYDLKGKVELNSFVIEGKPGDLDLGGSGQFTEAAFGIDYFQTDYAFDGRIEFDRQRIIFPYEEGKSAIKIYDTNGNEAELYGNILHNGLREFTFDLQLNKLDDFLLMNTSKEDNELYYGTLYVQDGIASITGDLNKLDMQAFAIAGAGSHLYIPIDYGTDHAKPDYINFTNTPESTFKSNTGFTGFSLNLSVQATADAQVDLIFDEKVGDIIQGRGEGILNMEINEQGEFSIFGDYEITQGDYLFTARNIINKKFEIEQGGGLTFDGNPYAAKINLQAKYPLNANASALAEGLSETEDIGRIPVNVLMDMKGSLLKPEIELSIDLLSLNEQDAGLIVGKLKSIQFDEQELNKQVFSLMVFKRFAPLTGFGDQLANVGVTSSISELLSNQLNYWLSQALNDKVNVSVGTENFQDVDLLVSAKLFNDRVTIERDGTIASTESREGPTIGNISIIIKLTPVRDATGAFRRNELVLEVFNRESLRFSQEGNRQNRTGIGIFYKKDFDRLGDIFRNSTIK